MAKRSLEQELLELEKSDPAVARAAREYDRMRDRILSRPVHRFFERGAVEVVSCDKVSRQAAFQVTLPASLVQTVTPALLGSGIIDQYVLSNPVAAWIPVLDRDRFRDVGPGVPEYVNLAVKEKVMETLTLFNGLAQVVKDPSDLIPMLPLGTYVTFRLRCTVDKLAPALEELESAPVAGVGEFRYALAGALAEVLEAFSR